MNAPLPTNVDVLIVGSGINSLVCAALLARKGRKVCVLEREPVLGGCIRTDELTLPGFRHDTLSTAHSLFLVGPAYAALGPALHEAGLAYCRSEVPTGVLLPDGRIELLHTSRERNVARFEAAAAGDGAAYAAGLAEVQDNAELVFALLGNELWSKATTKLLAGAVWKRGAHPLASFVGGSLGSCRHWLDGAVKGEGLRALLAPWVLHTGLGPDSALSAMMSKVIAFSLEAVGIPFVQGGNARSVEAFSRLIEAGKGSLHTGADVVRVLVRKGRATGVALADGREISAKEVVCNVTPTQLYSRLLGHEALPPEVTRQATAYRYGKGNMQIHLALDTPPEWAEAALREVGYIHLSGGPEAVSKAVNEAERGLLPAKPTICVAQPSAVDSSRAPAGKAVLWIQLPECPRVLRGDAASQLAVPVNGQWDETIREAYADRVIDQLGRHLPDLKASILGRKVISPADLQALNINLVGGDPYGGACDLDQSFLWRPLRATRNHETPIAHLWHIGASTHPGPGLGGTSGFHVAQRLGAA